MSTEAVAPEMTVEQVAARMQKSVDYVYSLLRANKMPGRKIGRTWRVTESDYQEFLAANRSPMAVRDASGLSSRSRNHLARRGL